MDDVTTHMGEPGREIDDIENSLWKTNSPHDIWRHRDPSSRISISRGSGHSLVRGINILQQTAARVRKQTNISIG
jgi:hypothetical protein